MCEAVKFIVAPRSPGSCASWTGRPSSGLFQPFPPLGNEGVGVSSGERTLDESLLLAFPIVIEQVVVWGDMDAYRHVNNVVYFRYFENARLEYFRRLDWMHYERDTGIGPILATTSAKFRKPLTYPDTIRIGARAVAIGADRFTLEHLIVSDASAPWRRKGRESW